jgi:hypothetical protein
VEVFGIDGPDLNGDGVPDLLFRRPSERGCSEPFSIVLLGPVPLVLVDFDLRLDGALTVDYAPREKANVLSLYACWFQYFEDRKLLSVNVPIVHLKIEGKSVRNVSFDFWDAYEVEVNDYAKALKTQGDEIGFLGLSSTQVLNEYPDDTSANAQQLAHWETLHRTRELILGIEFRYLYGSGQKAAREYLEKHWPKSEVEVVWREILKIYNQYPPANMNIAAPGVHAQATPSAVPTAVARAPEPSHPELRSSVNCLSTGGCYIRAAALKHVLTAVDAHPTMRCAVRLRAVVDSPGSNPVIAQWLMAQGDAARLATSLTGERERVEEYISAGKGSGGDFQSAESAENFLWQIRERAQALGKKLDLPEFSQMRETCKRLPED